jgi:hypothetical protein|uniref:sialidase family protein n=1 Tax=Prosthecobacter sp. TaxID=1965333 RepID=UPI0037848CE8
MKAILCVLLIFAVPHLQAAEPVEFTVKLETVMKHDDGQFLWFHPRAAAMPGGVMMTIQRHLKVSDYYSGLHFMTRQGVDGAWTGPLLTPELDWQKQPDGVTLSVADVTPGWHEKTGKLIAIGARVRYSPQGKQLEDVKRAHQTVYAVYDPKTSKWTPWRILELPAEEEFNFARNACAQWLVKPDGTLLVPLYIGKSAKDRFSTTVAECRFDGDKLTFVRNGSELRLDVARGLYEPSLAAFGGRYYLTLRNDVRGYVSVSDDGLQFAEPKPWTFDDSAELGSYNTQQHWLMHSDGLFLVYTRRGANNDHIVRHRAPLFMARLDTEKLHIIRSTEKIVVPERGAEMGNFGANAINASESWVTVSEGMFMKDSAKRGAEGATFVARILWSKPNRLLDPMAK